MLAFLPSLFSHQGVNRVKNDNYAFLLESTMNDFSRQSDCNLVQIGGLLDAKGYGIGLPKGEDL